MKKLMNMTLSQKRKLVAATGLPLAGLVLMMGFQNCSPGVVQSTKLPSTGNSPNTPLNIHEDTKPVTVAYSENILMSMQSQTGLQTVTARTITANTSAKAKISEDGKADSVNAPMWMAVTNLAGEVCFDLVTDEKAKTATARRFFTSVDFTRAPASLSVDGKSDLVRRMARNFWGRNETLAEKTLILQSLDAAIADARRNGANDAAEMEDTLIYTCTAMLSSLDAIRF